MRVDEQNGVQISFPIIDITEFSGILWTRQTINGTMF